MRSIDTIVEPEPGPITLVLADREPVQINDSTDDDLTVEEAGGRCGDLPREEVEDDLVVEEAREELTGFLSFGDVEDDDWRW
jgi:hypothetical protein